MDNNRMHIPLARWTEHIITTVKTGIRPSTSITIVEKCWPIFFNIQCYLYGTSMFKMCRDEQCYTVNCIYVECMCQKKKRRTQTLIALSLALQKHENVFRTLLGQRWCSGKCIIRILHENTSMKIWLGRSSQFGLICLLISKHFHSLNRDGQWKMTKSM